jgi:DNA helicase-2/ATP-dependent DNA helicase PcrA
LKPERTHIILGPPGTGKTTELLRVVDELLKSGVDSTKICFMAFTRKAANEARNRAVEKFGLDHDDLPLFRTLHSLAYQQLGIGRAQVMSMSDYIAIAKILRIFITAKQVQEDGTFVGVSKGDRLLFTEQMARARMMPLREYWELHPNEDIYFYELDLLARTLQEYKRSNDKVDFIDMIQMFIESEMIPDHEVLIVDEAQDLTPLQWAMIRRMAEVSQQVHIAGDDDQAIFTWAGADVSVFQNVQGNRRVLSQSYRCPQIVHRIAHDIISKVSTRLVKEYSPREDLGVATFVNELSQIDMSKGTWLLLARNVYLLDRYSQHCRESGLVYEGPGSPLRGSSLRAIIAWEDLRKGRQIKIELARVVYEHISSGSSIRVGKCEQKYISMEDLRTSHGLVVDSIWHHALDKIPEIEREYFLAALRSGEKLLKEPRIKVSTIHSAKGGEADNVVIITDMAQRTFQELQLDPDPEWRVWYVAVTRAKCSLFIVQPTSSNCIEI